MIGVVTAVAAVGRQSVALANAFGIGLEGVGGGDELALDAEDFAGFQEITEGTGTTAATADQADFELFGGWAKVHCEQGTGGKAGS